MRKAVTATIAGLGVIGLLGVGFSLGVWWHARAVKGDWNDAALRATLRRAWLDGEKGKRNPVFVYEVQNTTAKDYAIRHAAEVDLFVRDAGALSHWPGLLELELPVFIPSGDKAIVTIHVKAVESHSSASDTDEHVLADRAQIWNAFDDIVAVDQRHRYRIEFATKSVASKPSPSHQ